MKLSTRAVHAGERQRPGAFRPISTPIYSSSTFVYDTIETIDRIAAHQQPGYWYSRYDNPTSAALEHAVAALEEAEVAASFASGMAAMHAAILAAGIQSGDRVVCSQNVYGATSGLLNNFFAPFGVSVSMADLFSPAEAARAIAEARTRLVISEVVSNPLLRIIDVARIAEATHAAGAKLLIDSTFTTPVLCRPLGLGADYVVHSATKYLAGHGDVMGGIVLARAADADTLGSVRKLVGGILGPFEAWLVLRGVKTLPLRMERQCRSALQIAERLERHSAVEQVIYPGLASHPDHALARAQFADGLAGAVVSFTLRGAGKSEVFRFLDGLKLCVAATSVGDVQSLMLYPVMSSHRDLSPRERARIGITDNLIRLSVGIEDADDIVADIEQAASAVERAPAATHAI